MDRPPAKRKKLEEGFQPYLPSTTTSDRSLLRQVCREIDSFMSEEGVASAVDRDKFKLFETEKVLLDSDTQVREMAAELEELRSALHDERHKFARLREEMEEIRDVNIDLTEQLRNTKLQAEKFRLEVENELRQKDQRLHKFTTTLVPTRTASTPLPDLKDKEIEDLKCEIGSMRATVAQLTKEKATLQAQSSILESNTLHKCKEQERQLRVLQHEHELLRMDQQQLTEQNQLLLKERDQARADAVRLPEVEKEAARAHLEIARLTAAAEIGQDVRSVASAFYGEQAHTSELEEKCSRLFIENKYLKEKLQNVDVLNEKNCILASKLERRELESLQLAKLQAAHNDLLALKKKWEGFFGDLTEYQSEEQILTVISNLQKDKEVLIEKNGYLQAEVKRLELMLKVADGKIDRLAADLERAQSEAQIAQGLLRRQQVLVQLRQQECDDMKRVLDSYRQEDSSGNHDRGKDSLIASLEQQLAEKEKSLQTLMTASLPASNEKVELLTAEVKRLNEENNALANQVASYEQRLGRGEYDPSTTKVLHMVINPTSKARRSPETEMLHLRRENQELRMQMELSSSGGERGEHDNFDAKRLRQENEALRQGLENTEKSNRRLMQVCQKKISEFRETMCRLFGYKISYFEENHKNIYQLKSIYSERDGDELLFLCSKQGKEVALELLATDFSNTLDEDISAFLWKCHSIPAFLSHVTLNLFNKKTFKIN